MKIDKRMRDDLDFVTCPGCRGSGTDLMRTLDACQWCGGGGVCLLKTAIEWLIEKVYGS